MGEQRLLAARWPGWRCGAVYCVAGCGAAVLGVGSCDLSRIVIDAAYSAYILYFENCCPNQIQKNYGYNISSYKQLKELFDIVIYLIDLTMNSFEFFFYFLQF